MYWKRSSNKTPTENITNITKFQQLKCIERFNWTNIDLTIATTFWIISKIKYCRQYYLCELIAIISKKKKLLFYPRFSKVKSNVTPNFSRFGRKISVIKSIWGAISAFVPPFKCNTDVESPNKTNGRETWRSKATLLNHFSKKRNNRLEIRHITGEKLNKNE